ncbi:macro domain-containing protein [Roseburia hominis]
MPFTIVRQDITKLNVDAIVNAANTDLQMGGGVCGAIFKAAGARRLQAACNKVAPIETGGAAITPGFALPAKYVIHAAGPIYRHWSKEQNKLLLRSAYMESLKLAKAYDCESIAFPLISSGIYGYPKVEALEVASLAIQDFLIDHDMDIYLAVFDKSAFLISQTLMAEVESYIDEHYVETHYVTRNLRLDMATTAGEINAPTLDLDALPMMAKDPFDDLIGHLDEPFSDTLLKLIDAKGKTDVEVYKKANIDRKLFSRIRSVKGYTPKKSTILSLAIALELSLSETDDLLARAGYTLSHASKFDVIVEYFIINGKYNIFDINEVLFKYDQPLLNA